MLVALLVLPLLGALLVAIPGMPRRHVILGTAILYALLDLVLLVRGVDGIPSGWIGIDAPALLVLSATALLFVAVAAHLWLQWKQIFHNKTAATEAVFSGCLLAFLATMTLVIVARHFGLLWIGLEATTLATAPLIYTERSSAAVEATWKYLIVCSVGIALGLLGNYVLVIAMHGNGGVGFRVDDLVRQAASCDRTWLRAAFVFFLVGYGTKMGLAPMHTWLPDAYSEAPAPVSALFSGALVNCVFLALMRVYQVMDAAGDGEFARSLFLILGLLSLAMAVAFMLRQGDFKRLLAYSSLEHMGILAFGIGIGGAALSAVFLHVVNHMLIKGMLFLLAGNIVIAFHTRSAIRVRGMVGKTPALGALWLVGLFAISGSPPFGMFISEFQIIQAAFAQGRFWQVGVFLGLLFLVFLGMGGVMLRMALGESKHYEGEERASGPLVPSLVLGVLALALGLHVPDWLNALLENAAGVLGGGRV